MQKKTLMLFTLLATFGLGLSLSRIIAQESDHESETNNAEAVTESIKKEKAARKLLKASGSEDLGKQILDQMLEQFRGMPGLPPGFVDLFKEKADTKELTNLIVPIYVEYLDLETMNAVTEFYETDAGKKFVKQQPIIATESQKVGGEWGQAVAMEVMEELSK